MADDFFGRKIVNHRPASGVAPTSARDFFDPGFQCSFQGAALDRGRWLQTSIRCSSKSSENRNAS